jgi:uncharacterized protein YybS (DUF2232 family)
VRLGGENVIGLVRSAAVAGALFLLGSLLPVIGLCAMVLAPAPPLLYAVGRSRALGRALAAATLTAALIALVDGPSASFTYLLSFGLATLVMIALLDFHQPFESIISVTVIITLIAGSAAALVFAGSPSAMIEAARNTLSHAMEGTSQFYSLLGIELEAGDRQRMVNAALALGPAVAAISVGLAVLANLALLWQFTDRERIGYGLFGDLARWSTPEWLIWLLLASGFALFIPLTVVSTAALDLFVTVLAVYFCQGLAIISFYFKRLGVPRAVRIIIYLVAGIHPVLAALISAGGVFDMWVDFRRLKPPSTEAGSFGDFF